MPSASLVSSGRVWMAPSCPTLVLLDFTAVRGSHHCGDTTFPKVYPTEHRAPLPKPVKQRKLRGWGG